MTQTASKISIVFNDSVLNGGKFLAVTFGKSPDFPSNNRTHTTLQTLQTETYE